jgi:cytochrome P450
MCSGVLPKATRLDTLAVLAGVVGPSLAKGVIIRRPAMVGLAGRLDLDRRAIRRMQRLRNQYGPGPLMLRMPGRLRAVILEPADVARVLEQSPEPFAVASSEKRAALGHFEPRGVLVSHGTARADRRRYNEAILEPDRAMHELASGFVGVVREEARELVRSLAGGSLHWTSFAAAFDRMARRITVGDGARDDHELTAHLARLRRAANWAGLGPSHRRSRARFLAHLRTHLDRAEPGSLAAVMRETPAGERTAPAEQVPQWLFAFDAVALSVYRALALLATHPEACRGAEAEVSASVGEGAHPLPFIRAVLLETIRLWPTTPLVLRETIRDTEWETGVMPAGTSVLIFAPFFHRDGSRLPFADRLAPEIWTEGQGQEDWPLIPFSAGPAACPGRQLVLLVGSTLIAALLASGPVTLTSTQTLEPRCPLPASLDPFSIRFRLAARDPSHLLAASAWPQ